MSYPLGPPINDIARLPTPASEQYPSAVQEHYSSPGQENYLPSAYSPSPDPIPTSPDGMTASQPAADRHESNQYGPDETVVDLHHPVQEKKHTGSAANAPSESRMTGTEERGVPEAEAVENRGAEIKLSQKRKWFLLLIFSVAQVCDGASRVFYFTEYLASISTSLVTRVSSFSRRRF